MISSPSLMGMPSLGLSGLPGSGTNGVNPNAGIAGTPGLLNAPTNSALNPNSPGGASGLGDSGMGGALMQILSMLTSILSMLLPGLMQQMGGQGQPANDIGGYDPNNTAPVANGPQAPTSLSNEAPTAPPPPKPANTPKDADNVAGKSNNITSDPAQKQRLDNTLAKIARDPEGNKLLKSAEANGYTIEVGDPSQAAGAHDHSDGHSHDSALDAGKQINGITDPNQKKIIINPNAPDFDKTVVHELVHAATDGDGNSQTEEGMSDVVAYRVSSRMNGKAAPGSEQQIFNNKIKAYPNLKGNNDIQNSLNQLGISA